MVPGVISLFPDPPPDPKCHNCGHPFPWNRLRVKLPMMLAALPRQAIDKATGMMKWSNWKTVATVATIISAIAAVIGLVL